MEYIYKEGTGSSWTFVLLHGTGGSERDLIPIANAIDSQANVLALKGNVVENGALRFFRRHDHGQYDWVDLSERAEDISQLLVDLSREKDFDISKVLFIGFSNGSNMALHILLTQSELFSQAILFAPLYPKEIKNHTINKNLRLFLSMGKSDPLCSLEDNKSLIDNLQDIGAEVTTTWVHSHQITQDSIHQARVWYNRVIE